MAPRTKKELKDWPGYVEFGSTDHANLLGLGAADELDPKVRERLEKQLKTKPVPSSKRQPITADNYEASSSYSPGDNIIDGWTRRPNSGR